MRTRRSIQVFVADVPNDPALAAELDLFEGSIDREPAEIVMFLVQSHARIGVHKAQKDRQNDNPIAGDVVEELIGIDAIKRVRNQARLFLCFAHRGLPGFFAALDPSGR